jgi:hypothetical protein
MENKEKRHKFKVKQISGEKVTSKIVKLDVRAIFCGPHTSASYAKNGTFFSRDIFADKRSSSTDKRPISQFSIIFIQIDSFYDL